MNNSQVMFSLVSHSSPILVFSQQQPSSSSPNTFNQTGNTGNTDDDKKDHFIEMEGRVAALESEHIALKTSIQTCIVIYRNTLFC
jgi:hypothetical protein